jgi:predicted dehydrogenase
MKRIMAVLMLSALSLCAQTQPYRMAVIGLVHGHVWGHLPAILGSRDVRLTGVAEPNPALREEAKKAGVPAQLIGADYHKLIDSTKPDLVWAFVENNRHLEIVEYCAPRKINIIFEKPLADTLEHARAIQKLARQYGIQVMTNYQMVWWPANYDAKRVADSGALGQVYRLRGIVGHGGLDPSGVRNGAFFAWLTDPEKNGAGALMDFGCYNALWSLWYLGRPETVYAHVNHLRPAEFPKVEDNADLVLGYKNAVGIFEASWDLPRSYQDLEVMGRKGSVYMKKGSVEEQIGKQAKTSRALTSLPPDESEPVAYMVSRMRAGKPVEGLTALDINVDVVAVIDAAKESVREGKPVAFSSR